MKPWIAVPATLALVYRAWSRKSLTPAGIAVAALTAVAHAVHPWSVFFALLVAFFLAGTTVTKVKKDIKAKLTHSSTGEPGGEGPRTHIQVLANSAVASVLILAHAWTLRNSEQEQCWRRGAWPRTGDVLVSGIVANYAAVAADTFSSELGILATTKPRLITAPWRVVAPGTNGGVTATGLHAGLLGSFLLSATATTLLPFCGSDTLDAFGSFARGNTTAGWSWRSKLNFTLAMTGLGLCGSLLDSLLGALLQASVIDVRSGKVVEGSGGGKVPVHSHTSSQADPALLTEHESGEGVRRRKNKQEDGTPVSRGSRRVETGWDVLSNNGVNLVMAGTISLVGVLGTAWVWEVPPTRVLG